MRIDSHQHFWRYDPIKDAWISNEMKVIRRDFLPKDLHSNLEQNKISGCVAVQAAPSETETEFLLGLASEYDIIKGVVGWLDFTKSNFEDRLTHYNKHPKFKGIRHLLQEKSNDFMLREDFLNGMGIFEKFNLTYDLLVLEKQLGQAMKLVEKFPSQKFVLDHMAKPNISAGVSSNWSAMMTDLAMNPNVYCKLSGFLTETRNFNWWPEDFYPFFEVALKAFGENRLMFGSDWPVSLAAGDYNEMIGIVEKFLERKGEIVFKKVMGENALKFYQL